MTKIKFCGLSRLCDIEAANELKPDYVGFVFAENSKRYVDVHTAKNLKQNLNHEIKSVGVFVDEKIENIISIANMNIIDLIQLHGNENELYIKQLRNFTDKIIIKAFKIKSQDDIYNAEKNIADYVLLDSGTGTGKIFDWNLISLSRPYFLAGGLNPENVSEAVKILKPFAVDVSSGIEGGKGFKDKNKMSEFISAVRKEN